jgi:hypothetical protein
MSDLTDAILRARKDPGVFKINHGPDADYSSTVKPTSIQRYVDYDQELQCLVLRHRS